MLRSSLIITHIVAIIIISVVFMLILTKLKSKKRDYLLLTVLFIAIQSMGSLLGLMAQSEDGGLTAVKVDYFGAMLIGPSMLLFIQYYCEVKLPRTINYLTYIIAFFVILLVWTTPYHTLFYLNYFYDEALVLYVWDVTPGPLFSLGRIVPLTCLLIAFLILIIKWRTVIKIQKKRYAILLYCTIGPALAQPLYLLTRRYIDFDFTIVFVVVAIILLYFGLARYDLLENEETIEFEKSMREKVLAAENAALERLDRMKTELMRTMAHETVTPLTIIMGLAEITADEARKGVVASDAVISDLDAIAIEAGSLADLMAEMRQNALANEYSKDKRPVDITKIIKQVVALFTRILEKKGTMIKTSFEDDLPLVTGNDVELTQVMFNLLRNAEIHAQTEIITIRVEAENGFVKVTVYDKGVGIPSDILPNIFDRGVHGDNDGSGYGLAICKDIITAYNGEIWIENKVNYGTCVIFTLPVSTDEGGLLNE